MPSLLFPSTSLLPPSLLPPTVNAFVPPYPLSCWHKLTNTAHQAEKALVAKMTKVELNDAIESARRARQVDENGQHVCGLKCPLRGALGHGGETST